MRTLLKRLFSFKQAPYYQGPVSDHFDGERFFNRFKHQKRKRFAFWRWQLRRHSAPWPHAVANHYEGKPKRRVEGDSLHITFVNHATVLIQTQGLNILTDPLWSDRTSPIPWLGPKRVRKPGVAFEDLPPIDVVLVSHNHYDHMDKATLLRLWQRDNPHVITPLGNDTLLHRFNKNIQVTALDWGENTAITDTVSIHVEQTQHWSARGLRDRNKALWAAMVIATPQGTIYFAGDAGYGNGEHYKETAEKLGPFRFAMLPIGAYAPRWFMRYAHMDPEEAVLAFGDLKAQWAMPIHYGTFKLSDEALEAPLEGLAEARTKLGVSADKFRALAEGETWEVPLSKLVPPENL